MSHSDTTDAKYSESFTIQYEFKNEDKRETSCYKVGKLALKTDSAANRIMEMIKDKEECVGIKIGVKKRGCNGYSYNMNYAYRKDLENCKDDIVDSHGLKVLVDPKAVFFIVGTTMNYEETELSSEFTFTNPNAKGECGCGESFNV
eukprot:gene1170-2273_t